MMNRVICCRHRCRSSSLFSTSTQFKELVTAPKSFVAHFPNFFSSKQSLDLFNDLKINLPWRIEKDSFGAQNRYTYYAADEDAIFHYVGLTMTPKPWTGPLVALRRHLEGSILPIVSKSLNIGENKQQLTGCLLNYFEENAGFIPWHCDEIRAHGDLKCIVTVSLGGPRLFRLRPKSENCQLTEEVGVILDSGSVVVMAGDTQTYFEHELPLETSRLSPERISLTFRTIVPGFEKLGKSQTF